MLSSPLPFLWLRPSPDAAFELWSMQGLAWKKKTHFPGCFHLQEATELVAEVPSAFQEEEGRASGGGWPGTLGG